MNFVSYEEILSRLAQFEQRHLRLSFEFEDDRLVLYHAGSCVVCTPDVVHCYHGSECGHGFYCFLNYNAAKNHMRMRYINKYLLDLMEVSHICTGIAEYDDTISFMSSNHSLFHINIGRSYYVLAHGGQFFTTNQYLLDSCVKYQKAWAWLEAMEL